MNTNIAKMSSPLRRAIFNPTSIPGLRPPRPHLHHVKSIPGRPASRTPVWGRWRGLRWESTQIGENESGHIAACPNEAILFFDSGFCFILRNINSSNKYRPLPIKIPLWPDAPMGWGFRKKSPRFIIEIQQLDLECHGANDTGQASDTRECPH